MKRRAYLDFKREDHRVESNTVSESGVVAFPTEPLIEMLLESFGFEWRRIDWNRQGIDDWSHLGDYKRGKRASYIGRTGGPPRA